MKKLYTFAWLCAVLAFAALPLAQFGCASKLEPGGAYSNTNSVGVAVADKPFMAVESAFSLAYSALDAAFSFERDNRAMLWDISHSIKQTMDKIRPQAVAARDAYFQARALYVGTKTPQSFELLKTQLSKIQTFSTQAQSALPQL